MPSHHQDQAMEQDQSISQPGQRKRATGGHQHDKADQSGQDFEQPSHGIRGVKPRPGQGREENNQPEILHLLRLSPTFKFSLTKVISPLFGRARAIISKSAAEIC